MGMTKIFNTEPIDDEDLQFGDSATSSDVLEHSLVDDHTPVRMNAEKEKLSTDVINRMANICCTEHLLSLANQDYMDNIRELNDRLDMVKDIARPGCSYEVLNTALSYISSLATILSKMPQKHSCFALNMILFFSPSSGTYPVVIVIVIMQHLEPYC